MRVSEIYAVCRIEFSLHRVSGFSALLVLLVDNRPQDNLKIKCAPVLGEEEIGILLLKCGLQTRNISPHQHLLEM